MGRLSIKFENSALKHLKNLGFIYVSPLKKLIIWTRNYDVFYCFLLGL